MGSYLGVYFTTLREGSPVCEKSIPPSVVLYPFRQFWSFCESDENEVVLSVVFFKSPIFLRLLAATPVYVFLRGGGIGKKKIGAI